MANRVALARSWMLQALPGVECFRARSLTHSYPRHSHEGYAIGVIEEGVGGLFHRGTTSYIPSHHLVVMNPAEPHIGARAAIICLEAPDEARALLRQSIDRVQLRDERSHCRIAQRQPEPCNVG